MEEKCPAHANAHWLFVNGLRTLTDDYRVLVATGRFSEDSPEHTGLSDYHSAKIHLPSDQTLWPNAIHIT